MKNEYSGPWLNCSINTPHVGEEILIKVIETGDEIEAVVIKRSPGKSTVWTASAAFNKMQFTFYKRKRPKNIDMILNAEYMKDKITKKANTNA